MRKISHEGLSYEETRVFSAHLSTWVGYVCALHPLLLSMCIYDIELGAGVVVVKISLERQ